MAVRIAEVARAFGVTPDAVRHIGTRTNTHWRLRAGNDVFVLRRFGEGPRLDESAAWEQALVSDLSDLGWPAPRALAPPRRLGGHLWLLMAHVGGRKLSAGQTDEAGYRWLGRSLAALHADLDRLPPRPQRPGWGAFVDAALPPRGGAPRRARLLADLRAVAPQAGLTFEAALAAFETRDLPGLFAGVPRRAIHSDVSPWNVLVRGGRLSGLLDFELAHLDVQAADLAFSRRGSHDDVVRGYLEVRPMPPTHLAALDALWLGSLLFSLWWVLESWRRLGRASPEQLDWHLEQLTKTRPFRPD